MFSAQSLRPPLLTDFLSRAFGAPDARIPLAALNIDEKMKTENQKPLFSLGQIVATPGAIEALEANKTNGFEYLRRHVGGDWGDLDREDKEENELSLKEGFRILSAYKLPDGQKIWIITEADRSVTTLLLPDEY